MEKSKHKYIYSVLGILLIASLIFGIYQFKTANAMKISVENNYNRAFHELVDYVDDIETLLEKSMLVSSSAQISSLSSELFRETTAAKACLAQLPLTEVELEKTEKFLSQIGDYTYSLSQKSIYNEDITDEEYKNLSELENYAENLSDELLRMQDDLYSGTISFGEIKRDGDKYLRNVAEATGEDILSNFENVEKQFQEYPSLIYDGPFSAHIEKINPVMLEGKKQYNNAEVLEKAKEFLAEWKNVLREDGESHNTPLESYIFSGNMEDKSIYAAFTKKGAFPLYFLISREMGEEKITVDEAISKAKSFLSEHGFSAMSENYFDKANGMATINFAYKQGEVVCYSDLIKVKVALDNGEIVGFESNGYLMSHKQREFDAPTLSQDEAKDKINKHLNIDEVNIALIPKKHKTEVLCYEIKGNHKERNFLIYINAYNGREEEILMLLESDTGILTV